MDQTMTFLSFFMGVILRIGVPVAITVALVWAFGKMDARWKRDAVLNKNEHLSPSTLARNSGCWEQNNCSKEGRSRCPAYANPDMPCWQVFRKNDGQLQERCLGCGVFAHAPVPVGD